jgi:hypothetical protein
VIPRGVAWLRILHIVVLSFLLGRVIVTIPETMSSVIPRALVRGNAHICTVVLV